MIRFAPASTADDADLRGLLRDNGMDSWITLALQREPSFFAGLHRYGRDHPVIARDEGRPVGMFVLSEHRVHVNGQPAQAAYLGGLRIQAGYRRRLSALRDGYARALALGDLPAEAPRYTSIASGNRPARRLLEAGLPGLPRYQPVGEVVALALPASRARRAGLWQPMRADEVAAVCALHNRLAARWQFAPVIDPAVIAATGAPFFVCRDGAGLPVACMALWNQGEYKQLVVRHYRQPLHSLRPLYNLLARWRRQAMLPPPGGEIAQTCLAFLAVDPQRAPGWVELVGDALAHCRTPLLTLGLAAGDDVERALCRRYAPATYRMEVYTVSAGERLILEPRPVRPEIAVL